MSEQTPGKAIEVDDRKETVVAWIVVALLVAVMFARALIAIGLFGTSYHARNWDYGTAPQIPAQAYSSTRPASGSTQVEKQVQLPPQKAKGKAK